MQAAIINSLERNDLLTPEISSPCIGRITQITAGGQVLVDYPGNPAGPVPARLVVGALLQENRDRYEGISVLLLFENGDPTLPIIVGMVRDIIDPSDSHEEVTFSAERACDVILDGKKMVLDAREEIVLRCGRSSLTLRKDGKIVVKGTQLISRSSGTNKIKGASVSIN